MKIAIISSFTVRDLRQFRTSIKNYKDLDKESFSVNKLLRKIVIFSSQLSGSLDSNKRNSWMEYVASFLPESYTEEGPKPIQVSLCDYASAGNGEEPSTFQVWMPQLYDPGEA